MTSLSSIISIVFVRKTIIIQGDISELRAKLAVMQDRSGKSGIKSLYTEFNHDIITIYRYNESNGMYATGNITTLHSGDVQVSLETHPSGGSVFLLVIIFALCCIFTLIELYKSINAGYINFGSFYFFFPFVFYSLTQYIVYFINSQRLIGEFELLTLT